MAFLSRDRCAEDRLIPRRAERSLSLKKEGERAVSGNQIQLHESPLSFCSVWPRADSGRTLADADEPCPRPVRH